MPNFSDDYELIEHVGKIQPGDELLIWHSLSNGEHALKTAIVSKVLYGRTPSEQIFLTSNTFFTMKRVNESTSWVSSVHRKKSN